MFRILATIMNQSILVLIASTVLLGTVGCNSPTVPSSDRISENMNPPNPPPNNATPPDFAAAAQKLGVKEAALIKALGLPDKPPTAQNGSSPLPPPRLDVKGAATKLGLSEEKLIAALNLPDPPQGDRHPQDAPPKP
jgi:hypothetical protein